MILQGNSFYLSNTLFDRQQKIDCEKFEEKKIIILVVADTMKKNNIFFGGSFHQNPACGQNNFCHHILHFLIICLHAFNFLRFFKFAKN